MKYYIETYGCQMNVYDTGKMAELLKANLYSETERPEEADVILVNTCSVREHAEQRALARIRELGLVSGSTNAVLAVCGCMAQRFGRELLNIQGVDLVMGPDSYSGLIDGLARCSANATRVVDTSRKPGFRFEPSASGERPGLRAFVSIMKGCSNLCSFCIVPSVRGPAVSRPPEEVLAEVRSLTESGVRDVTLIGQNVNAYVGSDVDFAALLGAVSDAAGEARVRFTTSHPKDMSPSVFRVMVEKQNVCEHIHLPLQSGSDRILERMRRGYTRADYRKLVQEARSLIPGVSITTDIIVGFPGETRQDFGETCAFVEECGFDSAFMFKYSPRPGTEAASMADDVPREEKERRLSELISLQRRVSFRRSSELVGQTLEVLVEEEKLKGDSLLLSGRTRCNRIVLFEGPRDLVGGFSRVSVLSTKGVSLLGMLSGN
ncbi:MAG: tRNA (N6-isopentenyl adenosine(37)-C2)-methylthiotransferase MiaB [Candidatus Eiseniibacteriota bacterium]|nr:MAG: tRNA (N6-isopentenyl adenosine(37)-C2)-methylthiotransferase MiaB [Candidatus Eisenbacteria bacterium]